MYYNELYENIVKSDIQNSLYIVTKVLVIGDVSIEIFENTLIAICSYIGTFINIYHVQKWLDIIKITKNIIENDNINIREVFDVITKMCILCDIYIKNPVSKSGIINLRSLRNNIIDIFKDNDSKLSSNGIIRFQGIIPPYDNISYQLSLQIISGIIKLIKLTDNLSSDDGNKLQDISNKLRNCFDYISRKNYTFETKFYSNDNDSIWFLWGLISILYDDDFINNTFFLFSNNYKKKNKNYKLGLLHGTAISIIYSHKKNISNLWNQNEQHIIDKINEISLTLFNEIKTSLNNDLNNNCDDKQTQQQQQQQSNINELYTDGLDYLEKYVPILSTNVSSGISTKINNLNINDNKNEENNNKHINLKNNRSTKW